MKSVTPSSTSEEEHAYNLARGAPQHRSAAGRQ